MCFSLEEGCRFFVTALGNPRWIVDRVKPLGGIVYHDVTERKWAQKAIDGGVDGLICVNNRAGGHAGKLSPEELYSTLVDLGKPLVCAAMAVRRKPVRVTSCRTTRMTTGSELISRAMDGLDALTAES
jgi:nitronate monooxygenase